MPTGRSSNKAALIYSPLHLLPDEIVSCIFDCLEPNEKTYLPLRTVSIYFKEMIDEKTYLNLLNSPAVQQDIHMPVKTESDRQTLFQRLKREMDYLQNNQDNILKNIQNGCMFDRNREQSKKRVTEIFQQFAIIPQNNSAFSLYQCNKWLNKLNEWIIRTQLHLTCSGLNCSEHYLTRVPSILFYDSSLTPFWRRIAFLNLHGNPISTLPQGFKLLQNLNVLSISLYEGKFPTFKGIPPSEALKLIYVVDDEGFWNLCSKEIISSLQTEHQEAADALPLNLSKLKL